MPSTDSPSDPSAPATERPPLAIEVATETISTCQRRLKVTIPREEIDRYYEEAIGDLMPTALLPGFRPGRAPRRLVGSRFKSELADQIRSKLLTDALSRVSETGNLSPISEPDLDPAAVLLPDEGPMIFEFSLEVRPEFDLPVWKGLVIRRPVREIDDEDIEESLGNLLRERCRFVPHAGPPRPGDLIVANLRFLDEENLLSHAEEMEIVVRPRLSLADAAIDGFDAAVKDARAGAVVSLPVTVSAEAAREDLRGREVTLEVTVLDVKRHELPALTPALLDELGGFESEDALKQTVRRQLEQRLEYHRRQRVREQVAAALVASASWDLPPALLKRQAQRELERAILELRRSGFDDDTIRRRVNELRQSVMASTARALKEHFILERIAEAESIADTAGDYDEEIRAIAAQSGESARRVRASLERRGLMDVLRNQIIERKTVDLIMSHASFTNVPFDFEKPDTEAIDLAVCGTVIGAEEIPTATVAEATPLGRRG